jgi:hypothetical protein
MFEVQDIINDNIIGILSERYDAQHGNPGHHTFMIYFREERASLILSRPFVMLSSEVAKENLTWFGAPNSPPGTRAIHAFSMR